MYKKYKIVYWLFYTFDDELERPWTMNISIVEIFFLIDIFGYHLWAELNIIITS